MWSVSGGDVERIALIFVLLSYSERAAGAAIDLGYCQTDDSPVLLVTKLVLKLNHPLHVWHQFSSCVDSRTFGRSECLKFVSDIHVLR